MIYKRIFAGMLLISVLLTGCGFKKSGNEDLVVARVGNEKLTENQLPPIKNMNLSREKKIDLLNEYIDNWVNTEILYNEAKQNGFGDDQKILQEVKRIEQELVVEKFINRMLNNEVEIDDKVLTRYYDRLKDRFVSQIDLYKVTVISVRTRKKSVEVSELINNAEHLYDIARQINDVTVHISPERFISLEEIPKQLRQDAAVLYSGRMLKNRYFNKAYYFLEMITKKPKGSPKELLEIRDKLYQIAINDARKNKYQQILSDLKLLQDFYKISDYSVLVDSVQESGN